MRGELRSLIGRQLLLTLRLGFLLGLQLLLTLLLSQLRLTRRFLLLAFLFLQRDVGLFVAAPAGQGRPARAAAETGRGMAVSGTSVHNSASAPAGVLFCH